ncbi:DNA-binding response regulator [Bacteroides sp. AF34-31BH]|uniref:response regulator transcription factor n=1 Tax=Bacteroides sp. AF34-31BH TaxID=2292931 RepID=UPI000E7241F2|nr:LuxR C-terminal-related transcriptional regulator [Bacteroides sp. AF34-31BH]RJV08727.1 DNA-binding response regulator [Bacteroides sp. AF34-31BH]
MDTIDKLNKEFSTQDFSETQQYADMLNTYKTVACNYSKMENAIAVLSDLKSKVSYIYYGGFARMLDTGVVQENTEVASIWEDEIFRLIHPDDLAAKHLQELCFYHFIKKQPKRNRSDYYMMAKLRMKTGTDSYIQVLHRIFYVTTPSDGTLWLAICLYSPLVFNIPSQCIFVNSTNGEIIKQEKQNNAKILSSREKQILALISKGLSSKGIAQMLSISVHTVSRHRQEILEKLQVKNSIEACRVAKDLELI